MKVLCVVMILLVAVSCTVVDTVDVALDPYKQTASEALDVINSYGSVDSVPFDGESITVASWNLQVFGKTKAANSVVMDFYDVKLSPYDIIFVQEIRDSSGTAFDELCKLFEGYDCVLSSRDGRSQSQEQIGVIYREGIELLSFARLPDEYDVWERSPVHAEFVVDSFYFDVYSAHLKPSDVSAELRAFSDAVNGEAGNLIVIGDLNADCGYYSGVLLLPPFTTWNWLIGFEEDTTVSGTDCAYDRIIVNDEMVSSVVDYGVDSADITKEYSDHYIVWLEVAI